MDNKDKKDDDRDKENAPSNRNHRADNPSKSPGRASKKDQQHHQREKKHGGKSHRSPERSKNKEKRRSPSRDEDKVNNNVTSNESEVTSNGTDNEAGNDPHHKSNKKQERDQRNENNRNSSDGKQKKNKKKKNPNKIYRAPPTPPPEWFQERERRFVLDCIAVDTMSRDYSRVRPKLGQVIPPYNSVNDPSVSAYFQAECVQKTLRQNNQIPGEPIEGAAAERFFTSGSGYKYLSNRNRCGAGHSAETVDGHTQFMEGLGPVHGYNGRFGYRRTTPQLRQYPSTFGTVDSDPLY